jgi:SAM-dependent methyltransferase
MLDHYVLTAVRMIRDEGLRQTARYIRARLIEARYERQFGIRTHGQIFMESLGVHDPDAVFYLPTPYPGFFAAMKHVAVDGAFVDYGSGLGRILVAAATFPFTRVTGVELSPELVERCRENIAGARRLVCRNIEVIRSNAADWHVPGDVTVLHFYNPFLKQTLRAVVADIARSLREVPRQAWIMFGYPHEMDSLMRAGELIPTKWQKHATDQAWPLHPDLRSHPPGHNRYRIYRLDSRD